MSTATLNGPPTTTAHNPFAAKAAKAGGSYELPPQGVHPGHLVAIIDLGTHDGEYQGKAKVDRKLFLAWELSAEIKPNGEPFVIGREYTILVENDGSFSIATDSNLRKMIEGWRGAKYQPDEPIDLMKLLGRPCLVNVAHKATGEKTYANLAGITGLPKGMQAPACHLDTIAYHISMGEPPDPLWMPRSYGETLVDIIERSKEFTGQPIVKPGKQQAADTPYSASTSPSPAPPLASSASDDNDI